MVDEFGMTSITVYDGKYTIKHENGRNLRAERYGEPWRDLTGDGLILAMAYEIEELREAVQEFVDRVDRGEVRSKRTYAKFKALLAAAQPVQDQS